MSNGVGFMNFQNRTKSSSNDYLPSKIIFLLMMVMQINHSPYSLGNSFCFRKMVKFFYKGKKINKLLPTVKLIIIEILARRKTRMFL